MGVQVTKLKAHVGRSEFGCSKYIWKNKIKRRRQDKGRKDEKEGKMLKIYDQRLNGNKENAPSKVQE